MREPDFTLSAGPTMSSVRVQQAQGQPMIFDYDPVFQERFRETERLAAQLMRTEKDVILMQGEAVLGIEAAARGLVAPGMKCLNLVSGVYAKWFGDWLRSYGAEVVELEVPYDEALDPTAVKDELERHGDFELVALVHSETPSAIENPLVEIGPVAKEAGALVFADVVSAVGGTDVRVDDWGVDICVGGPQKCLAGPPGMSLVAIGDDAWAAIERNPNAPRGSFLSLTRLAGHLDRERSHEVPVHAVGLRRERRARGACRVSRRGPRRGDRSPRRRRASLPPRRGGAWGSSYGRAARSTRPTA